MLSVSFQIVGNFLLVFAIISQNFADISNDSAVIIGLDNKKDKIKKKLTTKCEIIIGLFWVIVGLTLSIQSINNFIKNISLCENWLFNISLIILLFIISILISKFIPRLYREKIDAYVNKKTDGEVWIE